MEGSFTVAEAVLRATEAARKAAGSSWQATDEARAALAVNLALQLDSEGAKMASAAVAKELRATLDELPVPTMEGSAVDDLAKRRAARLAGQSDANSSERSGGAK